MRRIALIALALVALVATLAAVAGADDTRTYEIEMYNAFGVVEGSEVRIAGVTAGTVQELDVNERKRAVATVELSGPMSHLGEDTKCSSEPQSLIAEYFIDCDPEGPELPDGGRIPAGQVSQTVQTDLVQNTMREPFKRRFQILINEFGTALAGNPDDLNEAIRLGAPALRQIQEVTEVLADQNAIIRDLNVNSDQIMGELAERRDDVVRFVEEARDTAEISITRREELSRNFEILDDFLAELRPTLAGLEELAREQRPLLANLRQAAPELEQLTHDMPPFNRATTRSLNSLGPAARVGRRALRTGRDEIRALARAGLNAPASAEMLADFLRDLDDPRRAVGIDDRAERDTGRSNPRAGRRDTKGYTGLEGFLNYPYYFTLGTNVFDRIGHKLAINLYTVFTGPCGPFTSGRDPETGEPGIPAQGGGTTTDILEAARCVSWLGGNQPGISQLTDDELPKYHPSVCPEGTYPERARRLICDPGDAEASAARQGANGQGGGDAQASSHRGEGGEAGAMLAEPNQIGRVPTDAVEDLLDVPNRADGRKRGGGGSSGGGGGGGGANDGATKDLIDFLFGGGGG